jgi:hypothetical protein
MNVALVWTVVRKALPYLIALALGVMLGDWARGLVADRALNAEKLAHQRDNATNAATIGKMSAAAEQADEQAMTAHRVAEGKIATLDAQLTQERQEHEADSRKYTAALAAGTRRLRIAVTSCSASRDDVPATAPATRVDPGAPTYADIDPATASRVFGVADDDQRQIDKLKGLQQWACAVRPDLPACASPSTP